MMARRVIVTGATGLIGKEVSSYLENSDYEVIRCSRSLGHDLTNESFVKEWFKLNPADHLVNLFALNEHIDKTKQASDTLYDVSLESLKDYLDVNIVSLFSVCREYAKNNKSGNIVNFSSMYGITSPDPRIYMDGKNKHVGYSTSKAAVLQLSKYLAVHLAPNIRVNTVIPGGVLNNQHDQFTKNYSDKCPLQRMMNVEELNGIVKYLCSEHSSYCTGAEFVLDGGYTCW